MAETLTHSERANEAKDRADELTEQHAEEWRQAYDEGEAEYPQGKLEHRTDPDTTTQDYLAAGASNLMALERSLTKDQQEELDVPLWSHERARNRDNEVRAA